MAVGASWLLHNLVRCLDFHSTSVSATLRTLLAQQDHAFVCELCHQACLCPNGATEAWISLRDAGSLHDTAVLEFLSVTPVRQCADLSWTDESGVHRGRCLPCYRRAFQGGAH